MTKRIVTFAMDKQPTAAHDFLAEQMDRRRTIMIEEMIAKRAVDAIFGEDSFNEDALDEIEAPVRHPNDAMAQMNPIKLHDDPNAAPGQFKASDVAKDHSRVADTADRLEDPYLAAKRGEVDAYIASRRPADINPSFMWTPDRSAYPAAANSNDILKYYPIFRIASNLVLANQNRGGVYESTMDNLEGVDRDEAVAARLELAMGEHLEQTQLEQLAALHDALVGPDETVNEAEYDPSGKSNRDLWDEYSRRAVAHGSGSRHQVMDTIESAIAKTGGPEAVRKMKLYTELRSVGGADGAVSKMADDLAAKA